MKKVLLLVFTFMAGSIMGISQDFGDYPDRPITIINSNKPGGVIDVMSRKLALIAKKYSDVNFIIENVPGGSGAAAMNRVLNQSADGYTLLATLKSFISTSLMSETGMDLDDFHLVAVMVYDWEAIITNGKSSVVTLEDIIADAQRKDGRQKWLGPNTGGLDHLMALETWEKCGIQARWIPFEGSSLSIAALLGQNGIAYVGNPIDVKGRPDLRIAAVAAPMRLPAFPEAPTFKEKGFDFTQQMWRGFSVKKGTPAAELSYLEDLFFKISQDSEWQDFIRSGYADPVFFNYEEMDSQFKKDEMEARRLLTMAGVVNNSKNLSVRNQWIWLGLLFLAGMFFSFLFFKIKKQSLNQTFFLCSLLLGLSFYFMFLSFYFPRPAEGSMQGPSMMPRIWAIGLLILTGLLMFYEKNPPQVNEVKISKKSLSGLIAMLLIGYFGLIFLVGFYLSTVLFAGSMFWVLHFKKPIQVLLIISGFLLLVYLFFEKGLNINLPNGIWI